MYIYIVSIYVFWSDIIKYIPSKIYCIYLDK